MTGSVEGRFWTAPNVLSLSRLAALPVWWWIMITPSVSDWWGGALILYAIVSDVLDGYLARRLGQVTRWGKILDPVGDKIAALVVGIFCIIHRDLPIWAFAVTVFRDVVLLVGGWVLFRRRGVVPSSVDIGRYAALLWGLVLLFYAFDWQPYARIAMWPGLVLYNAAGVAYLWSVLNPRPE